MNTNTDEDINDRYYTELAAAFVLGSAGGISHERLVRMGQAAGLKMHRFKKSQVLPRVAKAIGMLKSIAPVNLLDIGSGRGTGLTQVLMQLPDVTITAVEQDPALCANLEALAAGLKVTRKSKRGDGLLYVHRGDATSLPNWDGFDAGTALEVLEHIQEPQKAVNELCRLCRKVVFSVPSEPDDNPDHLHLLTPDDLKAMFLKAGAKRITFDSVPGHTVGLATIMD